MKLALIPPIDMLDLTCETDMQLMLPQLIDNERYAYTYRQHCKDPDQYVILDNGEAEGVYTPPENLLDTARYFQVNEVIIPDVIGDYIETMRRFEEFVDIIDNYEDHFTERLTPLCFMFVAQGKNEKEVKLAIETALQYDKVSCIALPRHLVKTLSNPEARLRLAKWFEREHGKEGVSIHLLGGAPTHPTEIKMHSWPRIVRSHDTSSPWNFAHAGKTLRLGNTATRPPDYFDLPDVDFMMPLPERHDRVEKSDATYLEKNIRLLKGWCGA